MGNLSPHWISATGYVILIYFLSIITITVYIKYRKVISENHLSISNIPWIIVKTTGASYSTYQIINVIFISVIFIGIIAYAASKGVKPVILGSLLGALPVFLFEINKGLRNPHIVITDVRIIKYPDRWWVFGSEKTDHRALNSIGVHVTLRNDGRETASDCMVTFISDKIKGKKYHTRWADQNSITLNLSPREEQVIDLLWVNLNDEIVRTGNPDITDDENHYPPGSYSKTPRRELSTGIHKLDLYVHGDNLAGVRIPVIFNGKKRFKMTNDIINAANDWSVIHSIKSSGESYVVQYSHKADSVLEISENLSNISYLNRIEEFNGSKLAKQNEESYEDALKRNYTVKWE